MRPICLKTPLEKHNHVGRLGLKAAKKQVVDQATQGEWVAEILSGVNGEAAQDIQSDSGQQLVEGE